jgi:hypothetical protein
MYKQAYIVKFLLLNFYCIILLNFYCIILLSFYSICINFLGFIIFIMQMLTICI